MSQDQRMLTTLTIDDCQMDLRVINVSGYEALNIPFGFIIDVLSTDPTLPVAEIERQAAYLTLRPDNGVHGRVISVTRLYTGSHVSLYRLNLGPSLLDLQQPPQRRVFQGLNVPQIIAQLLDSQGIDKAAYYFEPLVGVYPPRDVCVQHDETDLHLLQRLCEEEGIHFRFEHQETAHLLVFADDPACFPHRRFPVDFQPPALRVWHAPAISYLAERWALQPATLHHGARRHDWEQATANPEPAELTAANHRYEASANSRMPTEQQAHDRQISARTLERQRCERRHVLGLGAELPLTCGQIIQLQDHPEARLNDQWLLTEVTHVGKQPQALKGFPAEDCAAILEILKTPPPPVGAWPKHCEIGPFERGYRNSFRALPWEMPFRAPLRHCKPGLAGLQAATLMSSAVQHNGQIARERLSIRLDQHAVAEGENARLYAALCLPAAQISHLRTGSALLAAHVDDDPDRPVIYAAADEQAISTQLSAPQRIVDSSAALGLDPVHLDTTQTLSLTARHPLKLTLGSSQFEITEQRISLTGKVPKLINKAHSPLASKAKPTAIQPFFETDLRLTDRPGLNGKPLPNQLWYIVRMHRPGLEFLARLHPEDFLFEGKTDHQGYFGLNQQRLRQLAAVYREAPADLCLVHPGHCISLQAWFEQNWPERLHRAFMQYR